MIQANELRIENKCSHGTVIGIMPVVEHGDIQEICCMDDLGGIGYFSEVDIEPIPLTEQWLVKFGFIEDEPFQKGRKFIHIKEDFTLFIEGANIFYAAEKLIKVESVHEIQNLYWCLVGEELTTIN